MKNTPFQITEGLFDHMVVQRGGAAVFGGVCQSAGVVRVIVRRGSAVVRRAVVGRARAGKFTGRVPRVPAGGPYDFEVQLNGASVHVRDVLVGDVWLLGGQSNMQGCGRLRAAARPNSYVRAFYMEDRWAVARDPLHDMSRCVDAVHIELNGGNRPLANTLTGTGPGVAFGQELARRTGIPQGLIACAHGGTSMAQWDPARKADGGRSLYGALVRRLRKNGGAATGLVWYQGESDAGAEAAACYTEKMRELVSALRRDARNPKLAVALVQIGRVVNWSPGGAVHWNSIQEQQRRLAERIRLLTCVPAIDLTLDDGIHISGRDQNRLGRRLAAAVADLRQGRAPLALARITVVPDKGRGTGKVILQYRNVVGRLISGSRPAGFSIPDAGGTESVSDVQLDGDCVVVTSELSTGEVRGRTVSYGAGLNPYCNITDEADRSLPVLGPLDIAGRRALTSFARAWRVGRIAVEPRRLTRPPAVSGAGWKAMKFTTDFADCHPIFVTLRDGGLLFAVDFLCQEPMRLQAHLGYDGPITVWCDGRQILCDPNGTNPARADEEVSRQFSARRGRHSLRIYLSATTGTAWGVFLRLERLDVSRQQKTVILPSFC